MRRYLPILLLLGALPAHAQNATPREAYRVEEHGGGLGVFVDQAVAFTSVAGRRWVAERSRHDRNWCGDHSGGTCKPIDARTHAWIDSASCPQLVAALRDLSAVTPPRLAGPDVTDFWISADTTMLTITGHPVSSAPMSGAGGEESLTIRQVGGAYRTWWTNTEKALQGCWSSNVPVIEGKPLVAALAEQP
ncbi:hypothetical protein P6144_20075 [Sphingomonas sp. HITSZ_GF]|uniref:hypothetical protein n=1 Tax=Sphingomonas sp. HITSZ_GF TaxID=3037247 RepID=UPI00240E508F|nr:hypothetical protein [Sphingomonas sp. HITSZ_GF]MDG2535968.1 hypothetical protein [Sphingomonas sp. HITSZ_GF]